MVARDRDKLSETGQRRLRPSIYLPRFSDMSKNLTSAARRRRKCCQLDLWNINHTLLLCHIKWPIFSFHWEEEYQSLIEGKKNRLNKCIAHAASHELVHDFTFHRKRWKMWCVNMILAYLVGGTRVSHWLITFFRKSRFQILKEEFTFWVRLLAFLLIVRWEDWCRCHVCVKYAAIAYS